MHDSFYCLPLKLRAVPSISLPIGSKNFVITKSTQVQSISLHPSFQLKTKIYLILEDFGISRLNEFTTVHLPSTVALNDSDRVRVL